MYYQSQTGDSWIGRKCIFFPRSQKKIKTCNSQFQLLGFLQGSDAKVFLAVRRELCGSALHFNPPLLQGGTVTYAIQTARNLIYILKFCRSLSFGAMTHHLSVSQMGFFVAFAAEAPNLFPSNGPVPVVGIMIRVECTSSKEGRWSFSLCPLEAGADTDLSSADRMLRRLF